MNNEIVYLDIYPSDYEILTKIMTDAFNEDTCMHTDLKEDGPKGYDDGSLIKWLNEQINFESCKIVYNSVIVGAYSVEVKKNKEYEFQMLFIDPQYRKSHLGTAVWKHIEQKYADAKKWTVETPDYSKEIIIFILKNVALYLVEKIYVLMTVNLLFLKKLIIK